MLAAPPARLLRRIVPLIALMLYGCSDPAAPVTTRIDARPHALAAPVVVVTNTDDSGPGSLRQAMIDAADGSVIQFDPGIAGQTVVLTSSLSVSKALTIEGPVPQGMTISGNLSTRVFDALDGALVVRNISIVNARATEGGGAIEILYGQVTLDHVLVANNQGRYGGGIGMVKQIGELVLVNSTVSGNVAEGGGGINAAGVVIIRNSTIAENVAATGGGGIRINGGDVSIRNSIIANNTTSSGDRPNCDIAPGYGMTITGRLLSNDGSCGDDDAENYLILDAGLGPLASNGGPTKTHALLPDSPAIDAGTVCTEVADQRYITRPQGASCDLGAFEFNDYGTYTITLGPNVAVNSKTGVITLTGTISCSKPTTQLGLNVNVSQTQKTTGRFSAIVQADGFVGFSFCGPNPSSWSVPLTPQTGKFEPGSATGTASTGVYATNFIPATVTSPLKVFQVK